MEAVIDKPYSSGFMKTKCKSDNQYLCHKKRGYKCAECVSEMND